MLSIKAGLTIIFLLIPTVFSSKYDVFDYDDSENNAINTVDGNNYAIPDADDATFLPVEGEMTTMKPNNQQGDETSGNEDSEGQFSNIETLEPTGSSEVAETPRSFGFYLDANHFWRPFASSFQLNLGLVPAYPGYYYNNGHNYYNGKYKFGNLLKLPSLILDKAYRKSATILTKLRNYRNYYIGLL